VVTGKLLAYEFVAMTCLAIVTRRIISLQRGSKVHWHT